MRLAESARQFNRDEPVDPSAPWSPPQATLLGLHPATGVVRTRTTLGGHVRGLAATQRDVWVATARPGSASRSAGIALRVDTRTKRVVARVRTGTWPSSIVADTSGVWAVNSAPFYKRGTLVRIDAATNRLEGSPIPLGRAPSGLAVGAGALWVADALEGTVRRIDTVRQRAVARIRVGSHPHALAFASGSLWVTNSDDGTVSRINPTTNTVVETVRVGRGPYGIAAGSSSLWVANVVDGTVSRIDAATGRVIGTIPVGGDPVGVAADGDAIWVTQNSGGTLTRLR